MTTADPSTPSTRRTSRSTRVRLAVVITTVLAAVGVLAVSGLDETLVYYRTPTELVNDPDLAGERIRLGGLVQPGSIDPRDDGAAFTLTDGTTEVLVVLTGRLGGVFQAGQNALVEGTLDPDGVFRGDRLMVRHSETYQAPGGEPYTPPPLGGENQ